jgi:hypothetical protein
MNPLRAFGHYATNRLSPETRLELSVSPVGWTELIKHPLFSFLGGNLRDGRAIEAVLEILRSGDDVSVVELNRRVPAPPAAVTTAVCLLAKMDLIRLIP